MRNKKKLLAIIPAVFLTRNVEEAASVGTDVRENLLDFPSLAITGSGIFILSGLYHFFSARCNSERSCHSKQNDVDELFHSV